MTAALAAGRPAPPLVLDDSEGARFDLAARAAGRRQLLLFYRGHW